MDVDLLYQQNVGLIREVCRNFSPLLKTDQEELESEALVIFMVACRTYNPDAGTKFSTWLMNRLIWRFQDIRGSFHGRMVCSPFSEFESESPCDLAWELSIDAQQMLSAILDGPEDLLDDLSQMAKPSVRSKTKKVGKRIVQWANQIQDQFLNLGWPADRVESARHELKNFVIN